ncbi:DUF1775 domain-containing protein [Kitasatospora sp. NPDC048365]|uniref:DUF1775 domain-containing protein n=1 Tax=Kitasatospora sp. NPDC048365 TaxID=3364050 RepID=UPI00370FF085
MQRSRLVARALIPTAVLAGAVLVAGPASAHVEVESATPQALAVGAVVAFDAEGESSTAGITEVKVALPAGLTGSDVTLAEAPTGWAFAATADGYTVSGPALAPGTNAAYKIKVRQLPDAKELAFKSLVTYSDGQVDRWIEVPQNGSKPQHPAPVLTLTAAAPGATPLPAAGAASPSAAASASASPSAAASSPAAAPAPVPAAAPAEKKSSGGGTVVIAVIAAAAVLTGLLVWRRRAAR